MSGDMILVSDDIETKLVELEDRIVRGQFNQALRRLQEIFDATVEDDVQGARRLIELVHLVAGNRRVKVLEVNHERRTT